MKSLSVIPFVISLIGYDICVEDSPELWSNGPEYIYRLKLNNSRIFAPAKKESCLNTTIIFKCRPFTIASEEHTDGLRCYIKDAESRQVNIDNSVQPPKLEFNGGISTLQIKNKEFEILYDKNGPHSLTIDRSTEDSDILIYRVIAHHLNLRASDFDETADSFTLHKQEKSMIGLCQTQIDVSTKIKFKSEKWSSSKCVDKIHLETLAYGDKYPLVVINKTRDTAQCLDSPPHFLGGNEPNYSYNVTNLSSFTEFIVAPLSFGSLTITEGIVVIPPLSEKISTKVFIDLRLTSIEPAKEPLKRIINHENSMPNVLKI